MNPSWKLLKNNQNALVDAAQDITESERRIGTVLNAVGILL